MVSEYTGSYFRAFELVCFVKILNSAVENPDVVQLAVDKLVLVLQALHVHLHHLIIVFVQLLKLCHD